MSDKITDKHAEYSEIIKKRNYKDELIMSNEKIHFQNDLPLSIDIQKINKMVNCSPHWHQDEIEVILVVQGTIEVMVSLENLTVQEGHFIVINHSDVHFIKSNDNEDNIFVSLFFDVGFLKKHFHGIEYIVISCRSFFTKNRKYILLVNTLKQMISRIIVEWFENQGRFKERLCELTLELFTILKDHFDLVHYFQPDGNITKVNVERYHRIQRYLIENFDEKIAVEQIANLENISKSYLSHFYKEVTKYPFQDSINFLRVWKSEKLLLSTEMSIQEISNECGFSDTKYYYKYFKKWYDCTPALFRKKMRESSKIKNHGKPIDHVEMKTIINKVKKSIPNLADEPLNLAQQRRITSTKVKNRNPIATEIVRKQVCEPSHTAQSILFLFQNQSFSLRDHSFILNWDHILSVIDSMIEVKIVPVIAFSYNEHFPESKKSLLIDFIHKCINLYGEEEVLQWEFSIFYHELDCFDEINAFISELRAAFGNLLLKQVSLIGTAINLS